MTSRMESEPIAFINRELSWLEFNDRVLEEAQNKQNPLFERLKFLSIVSSNLDEFYMIRVASVREQVVAGFDKPDAAGLTPSQQLKAIGERTHLLVSEQYSCYTHSVLPALRREHVVFLPMDKLSDKQREFIAAYYLKEVYPVLTPMAVDGSRPFPLVLNRSLNISLLLQNTENQEQPILAIVQVPAVLDRLIEIPGQHGTYSFVFLEDVIKEHMNSLFRGHDIKTMACFRITRNADLGYDEEGAEDLLEAIEQTVKKRRWGAVIRLEVERDVSNELKSRLINEMDVPQGGIFFLNGPLDLTLLMKFTKIDNFHHLRYDELIPKGSPDLIEHEDIYEAIEERDILLHHPYETFEPVIALARRAANDPQVLAIKQTLYRVSGNSPIVDALVQAAGNGKQVTVLVELKARFDEENNINWAKSLERAGCHVVYGLMGLKTHCKMLLVVRREDDGIKRYVHLGTGNYNDITAKLYTDMGLFTVNPYFGSDVSAVFNMLTGYSQLTKLYKLDIAPMGLRGKFLSLIKRETENVINEGKGHIIAKMNSLVDEEIIHALYTAAVAGVKIDLIVRGICCLKPGVLKLSENIRVVSIVGRFLEHSRIYYFYDNGNKEVYLSSADWMPRNLDRRVEILFPIEDASLRLRIKQILETSLRDTVNLRNMNKDGLYSRVRDNDDRGFSSQEHFLNLAKENTGNINAY